MLIMVLAGISLYLTIGILCRIVVGVIQKIDRKILSSDFTKWLLIGWPGLVPIILVCYQERFIETTAMKINDLFKVRNYRGNTKRFGGDF